MFGHFTTLCIKGFSALTLRILLLRNEQKYLGKINAESHYAQIRYLLWNLKDLLQILNGNASTDNERFQAYFSKDITFCQMYDFI